MYVYILASKKDGVLYVGTTNNLARRLEEHKSGDIEGFTKKYFVHRFVYCEEWDNPMEAIQREKNLKAWKRSWKVRLIEENNPDWRDLSKDYFF